MARSPRLIAGRSAAVTGAARGIGRATAQAFLAAGMRVAIGDVDLATAERTAEELGPRTVALPLDVTDRDSLPGFLDVAEEQVGPLDVLVNNAGIMPVGRFIDEDDLTARRTVDINLRGVILGMKLALARMLPRDRGHIVNIASQAGKFGTAGIATYSATKHAVVGLSESVRGELRLMGAHVYLCYVMPYIVNTELGGGLGQARGFSQRRALRSRRRVVEALQHGTVEVWVPRIDEAHLSARHAAAAFCRRGHRSLDEGRSRGRRRRRRGAPRLRAARRSFGAGAGGRRRSSRGLASPPRADHGPRAPARRSRRLYSYCNQGGGLCEKM